MAASPGISGILAGIVRRPGDRAWRVAFVVELLAAPAAVGFVAPGFGAFAPAALDATDTLRLLLAGLLVGVGTRLANGCTSGHGVCGLARLSPRSLAAVAVFMTAAFGVVFAIRHLLPGWPHEPRRSSAAAPPTLAGALLAGLIFGIGLILPA